MREYNKFIAVESKLKSHLLEAIPSMYFEYLANSTFGLTNITT